MQVENKEEIKDIEKPKENVIMKEFKIKEFEKVVLIFKMIIILILKKK